MKHIYLGLFLSGGFICTLNFYLSWIRYPLFRISGERTDYRHISGLPILGSVLVVGSLVIFQTPHWAIIAGAILAALDSGGIHWFIGIMVWHHLRSLKASQREC